MPTQTRARVGKRTSPGILGSLLIALLAASLTTAIVVTTRTLSSPQLEVGQVVPVTLRSSAFSPDADGQNPMGALVAEKGQTATPAIAAFTAKQDSPKLAFILAMWLGLVAVWLFGNLYLRGQTRGKRTRQQLAVVSTTAIVAAAFSGILLSTSLAFVVLPMGLVGILVRHRASRGSAVAAALLSTLTLALLLPFDLALFCIALSQALLPALFLPRAASAPRIVLTAFAGGFLSGFVYLVAYMAAWSSMPSFAIGQAGPLTAVVGGLLAGIIAPPLQPLFSWMCGDLSLRTMVKLERLSQPLLKQIAAQAPGSWQHSLAVAKLCENAGAAIDADVQLLRVGAYYHDLGKIKQPKFFIENNSGGSHSIHENIKACDSKEGIFEHITYGVTLAREHGLPERVIDFVRTHHGGGMLEYFWAKELDSGDSKKPSAEEYCYPGTTPQCPETAILCICDAVESACRDGMATQEDELSDIVQHIIFGKLRCHQLDESGLSLRNLRQIHAALVATLVQAHTPATIKGHRVDILPTANQKPLASKHSQSLGIRLDSQDKPSSEWQKQVIAATAADSQSLQKSGTTNPKIAYDETMAVPSKHSDELQTEAMAPLSEPVSPVHPPSPEAISAEAANMTTMDISRPGTDASELMPAHSKEGKEEAAPAVSPKTSKISSKHEAISSETIEREEAEPILLLTPKPPPSATVQSSPPPAPPKRKKTTQRLGSSTKYDEWHNAVDATSTARTPVPFSANVAPTTPRATIPLGHSAEESDSHSKAKSKRADSQEGLRPGEMVIGPPPATHPERSITRRTPPIDDVTVRRAVPVPTEARRPSDSNEEELTFTAPLVAGPFVTRKKRRTDSDKEPK